MHGEFRAPELAALRARHDSEVRSAGCGGHTFVVSPSAAVADSFRRAEAGAQTE